VVLGPVDLGANQIRGKQVRGELNSGEAGMDGIRDRFDRCRLGQTRNTLDQNVTIGYQGQQQSIDHVALADDHLGYFLSQAAQLLRLGFDLWLQLLRGNAHFISLGMTARRLLRPALARLFFLQP
jgi:hypothetical protein